MGFWQVGGCSPDDLMDPQKKGAHGSLGCERGDGLHQQVFTGVVATQGDVVDFADVHQLGAA